MFLFYFSVGLAIFSTVLYHLTQKMTPATANPAVALIVTYLVSLGLTLVLLAFFPPAGGLRAALGQLNWASIGLAFALVGLEVGFLLAYRTGWDIGVAAVFVNVAGAVLLAPLGLVLFRERLSPVNLLGIMVCIVGLVLINWKK